LLLDREFRGRRGESVSRGDYQQRFPEYAATIDRLDFATIDDRHNQKAQHRLAPIRAGGRLAHFELIEEVGSGASGSVWKARDARLDRLVALKLPRHERLTQREREWFFREGRAAAQLRHPNIVAVYDVGEDPPRVFLVTEFIDGKNLREWLQARPPRWRDAAELAAQLAEALHHAHEQGVVHRDLKPANVLVDVQGRPHIADFGLAKLMAETGAHNPDANILGTPAYMSPEQARGDARHVDCRADVYGLGALLYQMLSGAAPFAGDIATILRQVIHVEPRSPRRVRPSVPRDLETICLKAMAKDPVHRYASAQEMAVDLRRYLRGEPIQARPAGRLARSWRWLRRRPLVMMASPFVGVLLPR
jgi:serine/threonine-protein kinase